MSPAAAEWLLKRGVEIEQAQAIPGDASARRYWRLGAQRLFMDAAPPEDIMSFLRVQQRWQKVGLPVPKVLAAQLDPGFMLLEDVGSTDLKAVLDAGEDAAYWLQKALDLIVALQRAGRSDVQRPWFPAFSRQHLSAELALFQDWYLGRHLGIILNAGQQNQLQVLFDRLLDSALEQPRVWVHRDFHARNLMVQDHPQRLVMIDFQDAVNGPWTYDLASLLWDRYWEWGHGQRQAWIRDFYAKLGHALRGALPEAQFLRSVQWMALQRNLKILGIFCRLAYRDGKSGYLDLLPQFRTYVLDALAADSVLEAWLPLFSTWLRP